jgi:hypothetical protein
MSGHIPSERSERQRGRTVSGSVFLRTSMLQRAAEFGVSVFAICVLTASNPGHYLNRTPETWLDWLRIVPGAAFEVAIFFGPLLYLPIVSVVQWLIYTSRLRSRSVFCVAPTLMFMTVALFFIHNLPIRMIASSWAALVLTSTCILLVDLSIYPRPERQRILPLELTSQM